MREVFVIIDIQNEITKNYKDIIGSINNGINWAVDRGIDVVYIRHENLSPGARLLKPNTWGSELATDLNVVSKNIFTKVKSNALTCEEFIHYIAENSIEKFYITGADASICVKSTCYNLRKAGYSVNVLTDCITSWDKKKLPEMMKYYENKGCRNMTLTELH